MATVGEMLRRVESVDLTVTTGEAMVLNEQEVLDVNRHQLYDLGVGKDGKPLPPYTPAYARLKLLQRGKSIVDGYRSGAMQNAMVLKVEGREYEIGSEAAHTQYYEKERPTSFGLTEIGKRETWSIVRPDVVKLLKDKTGMG